MKCSKHILTGNEWDTQALTELLDLAISLKQDRSLAVDTMQGRHLALVFDKPSLRTRFSFTVAMHQLGGHIVESVSQLRKLEDPEDQIRVIQGYCDIVMIRTHEDDIFERMKPFATIPIVNGLSSLYHPCQTLADLVTLKERFGGLKGLKVAYIGDGNNILHSLLLMAPKMGIQVAYSCPKNAEPDQAVLDLLKREDTGSLIQASVTPEEAVQKSDAVYTDVWTSMGFSEKKEVCFSGYQVNELLMKQANANAVVMHCMPMERGKEISNTLPEQSYSVIFQQSENRLHAQKALLTTLI